MVQQLRPIFTEADIAQFIREGFILLKGAFPREVALQCREELSLEVAQLTKSETGQAIELNEAHTWTQEKVRLSKSFKSDREPWSNVISDRLRAAISQLMGGDGSWNDFGVGWWVITFPGFAEKPWGPAGHWHIDGSHFVHHINSPVLCPLHLTHPRTKAVNMNLLMHISL
jgi:hypothetical protein